MTYRTPVGDGTETIHHDADHWYAAYGINDTAGFSYYQPNYLNGFTDYHLAEDWNKEPGTGTSTDAEFAYAFSSGNVVFSEGMDGYGNTVIIDHGVVSDSSTHLFSLYAHLDSLVALVGTIDVGATVGNIGGTGGNYAPHLHFELFEADSWTDAVALSGGWVSEEEMEAADTITFDLDGNITSVVLAGNVAGDPHEEYARFYSSEYFIGSVSSRERLYGNDNGDVISLRSSGASTEYEIFGLDGNDSIKASGADDLVAGGDGLDTLAGLSGTDEIYGGAGDDVLGGVLDEFDVLYGDEGSDKLYSAGGGDILMGGSMPLPHELQEPLGDTIRDEFIFVKNSQGIAFIKDFEIGTDLIDISSIASGMDDLEIFGADDPDLIYTAVYVYSSDLTIWIENVSQENLTPESFVF